MGNKQFLLQMHYQVYWQVKAVSGWCASFPHSEDDLQEIVEGICPGARVEMVATSHGLYGDMLGLTFYDMVWTKARKVKFLEALESDCEFWPQKDVSAKALQQLSRAPLYEVIVEGKRWLVPRQDFPDNPHFSPFDLGRFVLDVEGDRLLLRRITDTEKAEIYSLVPARDI